MERIEVALNKTNQYISAIDKIETENRSPNLEKQLIYFKEIKSILEEKDKDNTTGAGSPPDISDIALAISKLKCAYYSFFPNASEELAKQIIIVWYEYLKKYKKAVLLDAVDRLITTPSEYGKAPNLPDVVCMCESIRFDEKYRDKQA